MLESAVYKCIASLMLDMRNCRQDKELHSLARARKHRNLCHSEWNILWRIILIQRSPPKNKT